MTQATLQAAESAPVAAPVAKKPRLYFIDHMRTALMILVVLHHVALVYGASVAGYYYVEPPFTDPGAFRDLLVFALVNQGWFMGAFFLLAGYFTPGSYDRKGPAAFLKERLIRLGIPLVVFIFVLNPIANLGWYLMPETLTGITRGPTWDDYPDLIGMGPLWFVALLLIFSLGYAAWRVLTHSRKLPTVALSDRWQILAVAGFVAALALITYLCRMIVPLGESVELIVDWLSFPTLAYLPQYLSFFVVGAVASRYDWFRTLPVRVGIIGMLMALAAGVILFPLAFSGELFSLELTDALDNAMGDGHWQSGVYALWDALFAVGLCLGLIPLFRRFITGSGAFGRLLARQSYAVYIIHIPIIVYIAYALRDVELDAVPKFGLVSLIVVPVCFAVAYALRRLPLMSRVL